MRVLVVLEEARAPPDMFGKSKKKREDEVREDDHEEVQAEELALAGSCLPVSGR